MHVLSGQSFKPRGSQLETEIAHDVAAHLNKASTAVASDIRIVGLRKMPVEAGGVELGQAVHFVDIGVDAVGDRNVDQAVVGAQRDSWLGPLLSQRVQP